MTTKPTRAQYQESLSELLTCRPVAYWPVLARRVGGVQEAIMLSQLLYWNGVQTVKERGGWLYKSVDDMTMETGLSKEQQQTARAKLAALGVIEIQLKGVPRCWRYRVDMGRLTDLLAIHSEGLPSNGLPFQWDDYSTVNPPNIGRNSRGMFDGKPAQHSTENPLNLNKNQRLHSENTDINYTENTPPPNGTSKQRAAAAQGVGGVLSDTVLTEFDRIGILPGKRPDLAAIIRARNWNDAQVIGLIDLLEGEYGAERAAALMEYRLKNENPRDMTTRSYFDPNLCPVCHQRPCDCPDDNEDSED